MKVAIVGGGIMGCATALALADAGVDVVVLERAVPGAEASSAAAGILGAQIEPKDDEELTTFVRARAAWEGWARELRETTGIDVGWRKCGVLRVARNDEERAAIEQGVAWQRERGVRAELLDASGAREVEPEIAKDVVAAAHFADDAQLDPPTLLRALMVAASRRPRVSVRSGATVERLLVERDRCVGVRLDAEDLRADATVLAAGSWSSLVAGLPPSVAPVRPVRGQMVLLEQRPPRVRAIVFGIAHVPGRGEGSGAARCVSYVVPRGDGRVLCGSTMEHAGFRKEVTAAGVHAILSGVLACVPSLASAAVASSWSNFRPYADDGRALVGASPLAGLFLATGHHRNGILLAKLTADQVTRAVLG